MDANITDGFEKSDNSAEINKQVDYSNTSMEFVEDNYPANSSTGQETFQVSETSYQVEQPADSVYNPVQSIQQDIQYDHQGQANLENIAPQHFYPTPETQYQSPYIIEETPDAVTTKNNGVSEVGTGEFIENTESKQINSEHSEYVTEPVLNETTNNEISDQPTDEDKNDSVPSNAEDNKNDDMPVLEPQVEVAPKEIVANSTEPQLTNEETVANDAEVEKDNESKEIKEISESITTEEKNDSAESISQEMEINDTEPIIEELAGNEQIVIEEIDQEPIITEPGDDEATSVVYETTETLQFTELQAYEPPTEEYITEEIPQEEPISNDEEKPTEEQKNDSENLKIPEKKPRRTRKPIFDVPMHLLGHDINKPLESIQNGTRALPKPRLGVKVPYRNLTSQIVSKAELEEVILERSRKADNPNKLNSQFARSLTQRLAKKLVPGKDLKKNNNEEKAKLSVSTTSKSDDSKIQNDDDLLAILEGEGDEMPVLTKETTNIQAEDANLKLLEREIALQQLQDLPTQEPKERIIRYKFSQRNSANNKTDLKPKTNSNSTVKSTVQQKTVEYSSPKLNITSKKTPSIDLEVPTVLKKSEEVEPKVKVNMILKTYSRKRKTSEAPEFEVSNTKRPSIEEFDDMQMDDEPKSDPLAVPSNVYVTKSSRVIKKKVIWDPDDDQTQKNLKSTPVKTPENKIITAKIIKPTSSPEKKAVEKPLDKIQPEQKKPQEKSSEKIVPKKVVPKKSPVLKPKRGSEVDRLLMDEGAVNMLYDLKGEANNARKKRDVYSVEKAEKELIKKVNLLKNDLVQNTSNESPKSLRKKEGASLVSPTNKSTPERKLSKDSTRSSLHTPPRSPIMFSSQSSMLIRRRSSSSISSDDEQFSSKSGKSKSKKKKTAATEQEGLHVESPTKEVVAKPVKGAQYKSFTVKRSGKLVAIDLNYINENCYFTTQVLEELIAALKKVGKDKDCTVVSLTSTSKAFCLGLNYTELLSDNEEERIKKAKNLSKLVKEFILCLFNFPKILVAGIQGECVGLGVTMLTLFDSVIASDTATFSTPYAKIGCLGEATFLLTYPNLSNNGLAAELLYANQTLKADEACRRGLISKLCWPEKYKETLKSFLSSIAAGSRMSLEMTKKQLRLNLQKDIEGTLDNELDILVEHWTTSECQENFKLIKI